MKQFILILSLLLTTNSSFAETDSAFAIMKPTKGNTTKGMITFTLKDNSILVDAKISGLSEGKHGFHIHEKGDCSSEDGKSAGGHFNVHGVEHGGPDSKVRHVGDLGNLIADKRGFATLTRKDSHLKLEGKSSIIGRAVIIHEKEDDLKSQPTGAAGARIACGVIKVAK